jgi:hypothetical protein
MLNRAVPMLTAMSQTIVPNVCASPATRAIHTSVDAAVERKALALGVTLTTLRLTADTSTIKAPAHTFTLRPVPMRHWSQFLHSKLSPPTKNWARILSTIQILSSHILRLRHNQGRIMGGRGPFQKHFSDLAKKVTDFQTSEQSQGGPFSR